MTNFFKKVTGKISSEVMELASVPMAHPPGHFYSPVVDPAEARANIDILWPVLPQQIAGIDFNHASHQQILEVDFPAYLPDYHYAETNDGTHRDDEFYTMNSQFGWLDCRALFVLLRKWRPSRIIEVGSGFSSLLMADVNRRFFDSKCDITCIEPFPRPFLKAGVQGINGLIEKKIQDVPLGLFESLGTGDILFIDSTHVSKTGSDVNYLFFEVLPRLKPGVHIHIHDIFLPNEYPKEWVLDENRSWNEQYLLRALLMYSCAFKVVFGCSYAFAAMPALVQSALNLPNNNSFAGGSIWIQKIMP